MDVYINHWHGAPTPNYPRREIRQPDHGGILAFIALILSLWVALLALVLLCWIFRKVWKCVCVFVRMLGIALLLAAGIWAVLHL